MKLLASSLVLYLSLLLDVAVGANAIRIHGKRKPWAGQNDGGLSRRAPLSSDLKNAGDVNYFANVTLGGRVFSVLLDTGSSDLTVAGNVPGAKDTGKTAKVNYAVGIASGPIETVQMQFEGFTVQDQAFILDTSGNHADGEGIIGLGPSSSSVVRDTLANAGGNPVLDRIFRSNTSTPNFITILLGRSDDPTDPWPGDVTVGDVIDDFTNVTSQPKIPVTEVKTGNGQHWQALLDTDGIIGPDGQPVQVTSKVKGSDKTKLNAVFDSGFSLPQVPKAVADAFYARVPGAQLQNISGIGEVYTLPCDVELNVTFKFAGVEFPIHPLDTSISTLNKVDSLGNPFCIGAFQPIISTAQASSYDLILGMAFLRNAYMLVNFGDFVDGSSSKVADPYIQLLPLTNDLAEAHSDFVKIRLDGIDNTANFQLLPATALPPQDQDTTTDGESFSEKVHPYIPYIIAGCATAGLILVIAIVFCIRSSRRKRYRRLHDPAPVGAHHEPPFSQYRPTRRY